MLDDIDRVRRFNRFYTRKLGILSNNYVGSGHSVPDLRVLYDIGTGAARTARDLATSLELDEGYLSRLLTRYEKKGWLTRSASGKDARRKLLSLTEEGQAVVGRLEEAIRKATRLRLEDVDLPRVAAALERAEVSFGEVDPAAVALRDLRPGDAGWIIQRHAEFYHEAYGFTADFELLVAEIFTDFLRNRTEGRDRGFIAEYGGQRLGSILCVASADPGVAKLRVFFVEPEARGLGLGRRLIGACLGFARDAGYRRMVLMTHRTQTTARAIYAQHGFRMVSEEPGWQFGAAVVEETWELAL